MLNFSKINVLIIYIIFLFISFFSILNFQENKIIDKKVNLGLDLQGGSYLLLEINSDNLDEEKIQSKVIPIKKLLKENNLVYSNFKIKNKSFSFNVSDVDQFELLFVKLPKSAMKYIEEFIAVSDTKFLCTNDKTIADIVVRT